MKISQKDANLINISTRQRSMHARRLLNEFPDKGWKLGSNESIYTEENPQDGYNCLANRQPSTRWTMGFC